ncbi:MAG: hypothetical protein QXI91_04835 [Candidatus Bathyarchaeia archaeon]
MAEKRETFEKLLVEAVDEALTSLGDSAKQAIYYHLQSKFKIKKEDIPSHLEDFMNAIESIFGLGANFLEIMIMKKLYEKVGQPLKWSENREFIFSEYVAAVKETFLKRKTVEK